MKIVDKEGNDRNMGNNNRNRPISRHNDRVHRQTEHVNRHDLSSAGQNTHYAVLIGDRDNLLTRNRCLHRILASLLILLAEGIDAQACEFIRLASG